MAAVMHETFEASELQVMDPLDCAAAGQSGRRMALALGFTSDVSEEIALVVSELASNLVKHAGRGALTLRRLQSGERTGIEVRAQDNGPGMPDAERSITDGYSTSGTLGYGLGAVNRLMDEMDVSSVPGSGTQIVCRRWIRPSQEALTPRVWDVGVVTRSRRSAPQNGDGFIIKEWKDKLLVGLIDGLGHGEPAQKATLAAQNYVQTHYDQPLDKIFSGTDRACRGTRGVVMALARFLSLTRMNFASVGNVEARALCGHERIPFAVRRGIVGAQEIRVHVQEFAWSSEGILVLHTDGLHTRWQWNDFPGLEREPAQTIASKLIRQLADENDDATVLTVKNKMP
jgi:anti-sigma regulatory factor (Ser/Thr protein kinase)